MENTRLIESAFAPSYPGSSHRPVAITTLMENSALIEAVALTGRQAFAFMASKCTYAQAILLNAGGRHARLRKTRCHLGAVLFPILRHRPHRRRGGTRSRGT
jgi:hypothetical protein